MLRTQYLPLQNFDDSNLAFVSIFPNRITPPDDCPAAKIKRAKKLNCFCPFLFPTEAFREQGVL